jgi:hypothetical protein
MDVQAYERRKRYMTWQLIMSRCGDFAADDTHVEMGPKAAKQDGHAAQANKCEVVFGMIVVGYQHAPQVQQAGNRASM